MSTGHADEAAVPVCSAVAPSPEAARFDPAWLTSTVVALAKGIATDGTFDAMPILADALQDAGCDNAVLLEHCRHGTSHVAGCWALQLLVVDPTPSPTPQGSILLEAARHANEPGYILSERTNALLGAAIACWCLCVTAAVHVAYRNSGDETWTRMMVLGPLIAFGIAGSLVSFFSAVRAIILRRRDAPAHRRQR